MRLLLLKPKVQPSVEKPTPIQHQPNIRALGSGVIRADLHTCFRAVFTSGVQSTYGLSAASLKLTLSETVKPLTVASAAPGWVVIYDPSARRGVIPVDGKESQGDRVPWSGKLA